MSALRAALYARVSTRGQNTDLQLTELRQMAATRGWVASEYVDHGESGVKSSRPALDQMLADAQAGRLQVVAVWKLDRLGRSTSHVLSVLAQLQQFGVAFVSCRDAGLDTTTPMGKMITTIIAAFGELERDIIRERVRAGVAQAKARGRRCGRPRKDMTEDQVAAARKMQAEGWGVRRIGAALGLKRSVVHRHLRTASVNPPSSEAA